MKFQTICIIHLSKSLITKHQQQQQQQQQQQPTTTHQPTTTTPPTTNQPTGMTPIPSSLKTLPVLSLNIDGQIRKQFYERWMNQGNNAPSQLKEVEDAYNACLEHYFVNGPPKCHIIVEDDDRYMIVCVCANGDIF